MSIERVLSNRERNKISVFSSLLFIFTSVSPLSVSPYIELLNATQSSTLEKTDVIYLNNSRQITSSVNLGESVEEGFEIYLTECLADSSDEILCRFVVRNTRDMRSLGIRPQNSRVIDSNGDEFFGSHARFGSDSVSSRCRCAADVNMPKNIRIRGDVRFEVGSGSNQIVYIQLDFSEFSIDFTFIEELAL